MPELPDIVVYIEGLSRRIRGQSLHRVRVASPFLLRTATPPIAEAEGKRVSAIRRLGKRIVIGLEDDLFLVLHLMIAGRLHWREPNTPLKGRFALAALDFSTGVLVLTEAGSKKRASLHFVRGEAALSSLDPGGIEVLEADLPAFHGALIRENHTLKRALTDPRLFSGIGNAYSDEILHRAGLSPLRLTESLTDEDTARLFTAVRDTLVTWTEKLRRETGDAFPEKVTAFRAEMAVHGRFGKPCPVCGTAVQRIVYAENECDYCPRCQTGGKLLSDRALSRLLRKDWPRTIEDLEARAAESGPRGKEA